MDALASGFASHPWAWASSALALLLGLAMLLGNLDLSGAAALAGDAPVQPGDGTFRSGSPRTIGDLGGTAGGAPAPRQAAPGPPANNPPGMPQPAAPGHPGGQGAPRQPQGTPQPATPPGQQPQPPGQGAPRQPQPAPGQPQWGIGGPQYAPATPQPAPGQPQGQGDWTLRDELARLGWDSSQFQDDRSAFQALSQQLSMRQQQYDQMQQLAQYGQFYLANMQDFQRGLQMVRGQPQGGGQGQGVQGQQGVQGGQPQAEEWWKTPEYDPKWESIVRFDPASGSYIVPMGHDPSIGVKYQNYKEWQKDTVQKLLTDPIGTLKPGLERLVEEKAAKLARQQVSSYDDTQFAQQWVGSQPWMFQKHPNGQVATGLDGRPLLTNAGNRFQSYVMFAEQAGVRDVRAQQQWAMGQLERDALGVQLQQMQEFLQNPAAVQQYLATVQQQQQGQGGVQQPQQAPNWQQPFNNSVAPGNFQPVTQQQAAGPADVNAQQRAAALNLQGARHISGGTGAAGPTPAATPNMPRRPLGRAALVGRLTSALQNGGIPVS